MEVFLLLLTFKKPYLNLGLLRDLVKGKDQFKIVQWKDT